MAAAVAVNGMKKAVAIAAINQNGWG